MGIDLRKAYEVRDPQGLIVTLQHSVWERIIGAKGHSELRDRLDDVLRAIRTPTVIQASTTDPESRLYYWLKPVALGKYFKLQAVCGRSGKGAREFGNWPRSYCLLDGQAW